MAHPRNAVPAELGFLLSLASIMAFLACFEQLMRLFQVRMVFPIRGVGVAGQRQRNQRTNQYCFHEVLLNGYVSFVRIAVPDGRWRADHVRVERR